MKRWIGAAAVCLNEKNEILMVLQGKKNRKDGLYQVGDKKKEKP